MSTITVALWVLLRILRHPLGWVWLVSASLLWLAATVLSPLGITVLSTAATPLVYEVAFVAVLAGVGLALLPLSEGGWFFARVAPLRRLTAQAAGMSAAGTLGFLMAILIPLALFRNSHFEFAQLANAGLALVLHATALGLLLLQAPWPAATRALALPIAAWLLPAALPTGGFPLSVLHALLDVSGSFESVDSASGPASPSKWAAVLALLGAAALIDRSRSRGSRIAPTFDLPS